MQKNYIEEKINVNQQQFEILNKEYQSIRKDEVLLKEELKKMQEKEDIDFLIFSPRGSWYKPVNRINEFNRRLNKLNIRRDELKEQMNLLLEHKLELDKLLKSEQTKKSKEREQVLSNMGVQVKKADDESLKRKELFENNLRKEISSGLNYRNSNLGIADIKTDVHIVQNKESKDNDIKNWNKNGTIRVKSNGNTSKFFDALDTSKKELKNKEKLSGVFDLLIKRDTFDEEKKKMDLVEFPMERNEKSKNINSYNKQKENDFELKLISNNEEILENSLKILEKKQLKGEELLKLISKVELCQKLLEANPDKCLVELKNLETVLQSM